MTEEEWQDTVDVAQEWDKKFKRRAKRGIAWVIVKELGRVILILTCAGVILLLVCFYLVRQVVPDIRLFQGS